MMEKIKNSKTKHKDVEVSKVNNRDNIKAAVNVYDKLTSHTSKASKEGRYR